MTHVVKVSGKLLVLNLQWKRLQKHQVEIIMDDSNKGTSDKLDLYMYMPQKKGIQNVFLYSTTSKGFTSNNPGLVMHSPNDWGKGPIVYSDWTGPTTKRRSTLNLVDWNTDDTNGSLLPKTTLVVTDELKRHYRPQRGQRNRRTPNRYKDERYKHGKIIDDTLRSVCYNDDEDE